MDYRLAPIKPLNADMVHAVSTGYVSDSYYLVTKEESHELTTLTLALTKAERPVVVDWPLTPWDRGLWQEIAETGLAVGAWDEEQLVGACLASLEHWNRTLWVWELRVSATHQRRGIGAALLDEAAGYGRRNSMRTMLVEVQSTNVPAIAFYRKQGFQIEAVDLSYYTNHDQEPGQHLALFMKRRLD